MRQAGFDLNAKSLLNVGRFFSGTLLSRISGMGRDVSMAVAFGDHPSIAAFMVAFRLSNLFRRLLGEGPFQSAFIPCFEGMKLQDPALAIQFFRKITLFMLFLLICLVSTGELILLGISSFELSANNKEIISLTAWMLPGLLFICLYGLNISLLHCYETFFVPSVAPFICNMIWILGVLACRNQTPSDAMVVLAKLVIVGFFCQWLLTLRSALKYAPIKLRDLFAFSIPIEVTRLAKSVGLGVIGVGAAQINACVDVLFARHADLSGPVYLWYSIRLEQLALAIFGFACVSTIVPQLSKAIKGGHLAEADHLLSMSFRRIWVVMILCSFAIIALGGYSVNLIYGRGNFSAAAVVQTTRCLWAYGIGLVPATMVPLLSSLYYAKDDFKTPTKFSLYTILLNIGLNYLFVFFLKLGAVSTALATSVCLWVNFWWLFHRAKGEGWLQSPSSASSIVIPAVVGIVAVVHVVIVESLFFTPTITSLITNNPMSFAHNMVEQLIDFGAMSLAFLAAVVLYGGRLIYGELIPQARAPIPFTE